MFKIESLKELVERARQSFRTNMPGSDAWIWPNNINPTAKVLGGLTHEVFGFADYIQRQKFALTADSENLDLHGEELGLSRRPTSPARFFVDVTVTAAATILVGARFRRGDGVEYLASAGGSTTGAGTASVEVISATEGANVTPIAGTSLEIIDGVPDDVGALAVVADGAISPGLDVEDDDTFRARILFRKRNPPHGGSAADYLLWASEVPGVSFYQDRPSVFVERLWAGPGTVRIFPLMFDLYADGIPLGADIERVRDHIEALRPAGALVSVAAPIARPIDITISGLLPNTAAQQQIVIAELRDAFRRLARVAGSDSEIGGMPYLASPTSFSRSWIWQAVSNATGEVRHAITAPSADIALSPAEMATLGNVSFV
jgi:uncharacterized phage protein gp47/JayE